MALYYPQMPAGSVVQFPYRRRARSRTAVAEMGDGRTWKQYDDLSASTEWTLRYSSLSDSEMNLINDFFSECEGRLKNFTFFDPCGNLLSWSEGFIHDAWQKSGALSVVDGVAGPLGGSNASRLTNPGAAASITQAVGIPGRYHTCFSVYVRSAAPLPVRVFKTSGAETLERSAIAWTSWQRLSVSGAPGGSGESQVVGLQIPAGAVVDLYGAQLEVQPGMSAYRRSGSRSGVYPRARFTSDALVTVAEAPGLYSVGLGVIAF